jgi:vacuolar-type H+-ATPase subunit E/Vma4
LIDDDAKKIEDEAQREVQRKQMLIDDEAKKIEDEAQREVQRKRNSKLSG